MEHISHFIAQLGEASVEEAHRVRFFPLSLSGPAFTWVSSLESNSIKGWTDLEKKFHADFYTRTREMRIMDLTNMRQKNMNRVLNLFKGLGKLGVDVIH